jgi:hypothetical protein
MNRAYRRLEMKEQRRKDKEHKMLENIYNEFIQKACGCLRRVVHNG